MIRCGGEFWLTLAICAMLTLTSVHAQQTHDHTDGDDEPSSHRRIPTPKAIEAFCRRVEKNPKDYLSHAILGRLYLRQSKEQDDLPSLRKSEASLRRAMELKPDYSGARLHLAITLQASHQFKESRELVLEVLQNAPSSPLPLATLYDAEVELGEYSDAEKTLKRLVATGRSPAILAREAKLAELKGDPERALQQVQEAMSDAVAADRSPDYVAWYAFRCADLCQGMGRLKEAEGYYESALKLSPNYAPAMSGIASIAAARGQFEEAATLYANAVEEHSEPPTIAAFAAVLTKLGQHEKAEQCLKRTEGIMEEESKSAATAHLREVARFCCDHDRRLPYALELARQDLSLRPDVHAYDMYAWACYKNRRYQEAGEAIQKALRLGTRNADFHYHAGMISHALGRNTEAISFLKRCLEINPYFSPVNLDRAKMTLEKLIKERE